MNKFLLALIFSSIIFLCSCSNRMDCDELPNSYQNYEIAMSTIKAAHFKIEETINATSSSWISGGSFYSCDGVTGFFILKTENQEYIYTEVPVEIWKGFKNSDSFGSYYSQYIKHRYYFNLNK